MRPSAVPQMARKGAASALHPHALVAGARWLNLDHPRTQVRQQTGAKREALVSVIDLAPTFLELAESPIAETMQGVSLLPVIRQGTPVRRYAFSEHNWHDYQAHERAVRGEIIGTRVGV